MVKITLDLINNSHKFLNCIKEYQLSIRNKKILEIENFSATKDQFGCIDLSDNFIIKIPGLPKLQRLRTLILINNKITFIELGFADDCPFLENLILSNNQISTRKEIDNLASCKSLIRLSLIDNLITLLSNYRAYVIFKIPSLRILDFQKITKEERDQALLLFKDKSENEIDSILAEKKTNKVTLYNKALEKQNKINTEKSELQEKIKNCTDLNQLKVLEQAILERVNLEEVIHKPIINEEKYLNKKRK